MPLTVQGVLADVSIATGSVTIGLMLTGRFVFQYLGWGVAAVATPLVMAITGSAFFGMSLAAQYGTALTFGPYSLAAAGVMAGAVTQVCLHAHATPCAACVAIVLGIGLVIPGFLFGEQVGVSRHRLSLPMSSLLFVLLLIL